MCAMVKGKLHVILVGEWEVLDLACILILALFAADKVKLNVQPVAVPDIENKFKDCTRHSECKVL